MSEIIVGDVLTWEPALEWSGDREELERPLTWAVTIRASQPVLPPLRGGELIVIPSRTLAELQLNEMIRWADIARTLSGQSPAGLVVEHNFAGEALAGVSFIRAASEFIVDAESRLNRTITEHRAELYRLGSDLSRALSAASIGGADLDALLSVAGQIGQRDMLLLGADGQMLGRSRDAPRRLTFAPDLHAGGWTSADGWTCQPASVAGGQSLYLAAGPGSSETPEAVRLLLSQTLTALAAFLGPNGVRRKPEAPPSREALLADLLLGRVPPAQIESRSQLLSIEPHEPLSVALYLGALPGFDGRIRTGLQREIRERACMLSPTELAVCIPESGWIDWWDELQSAGSLDGTVALVRSEQHGGMDRATLATRQARTLGRLRLSGIDAGATVYDLLLPLLDPLAFEPGPERLTAFANRLLQPLEQHDSERNSDVVRTLEGYLAAGGSTTGAAELLNVHRNTLGYRLRRIGELTGADMDDEENRLAYGLALRIRRLQRLLG